MTSPPSSPSPQSDWADRYWKAHLRLMLVLLSLWFLVSLGAGVLFVDELNQIRIGGFKLGFWFAQQGAIYSFLILIWVYVYQMNRLDKEYGVDEDSFPHSSSQSSSDSSHPSSMEH